MKFKNMLKERSSTLVESCNGPEVDSTDGIVVHAKGTPEYDANEGRKNRISMYRRLANLDEDFEITESNIDDWALRRTCTMTNRGYDRVKSEILGQKWSEYEE